MGTDCTLDFSGLLFFSFIPSNPFIAITLLCYLQNCKNRSDIIIMTVTVYMQYSGIILRLDSRPSPSALGGIFSCLLHDT